MAKRATKDLRLKKQTLADNKLNPEERLGMMNAWTLLSPYCRDRSGSVCKNNDSVERQCVFMECPPFVTNSK